ncbi:MAG: hypothetical protein A2096_08930 [Spirochaetes bacterium GWF1_41_5]|nr:MAG: hypothetical protein A2096_08930 [Spirochaetes bacterium GWF1_41_5]HBE01950.1 hypothetical protein [Spirochaetia bacterium]
MQVKFMHFLDYFIGLPACFLLSAVNACLSLIIKKRNHENVKNVLFIKLFGMGSVTLSLAAVKRFIDQRPLCNVYYLTFASNKFVFNCVKNLDSVKILSLRSENLKFFIADFTAALYKIRKIKFDIVFDFEFFSRLPAIISFLSGAACRVGFFNKYTEGFYRGNFLTYKIFYNPYQHVAQAYLDMVDAIDKKNALPYNKIHDRNINDFRDLHLAFNNNKSELKNYRRETGLDKHAGLVLFNPNVSKGFIDLRCWPLEYYAEIGRLIIKNYSRVVIGLIGDKNDSERCGRLAEMIASGRLKNFAGNTSLKELCYLLDLADLLVTNDTGPGHLAALGNGHIVTLHGPETPMQFSPFTLNKSSMFLKLGCSPCGTIFNRRQTQCQDNLCMQMLAPSIVWSEIKKIIKIKNLRWK